jgi:nickel-dependent lactate racemase
MRVTIPYGGEALELEIDEGNLVTLSRAPIAPNLADPAAALREALEHPRDYPALRLALTPEDQIAIAIDEGIPQLASLLQPLLEHIALAHVKPDAVTLVCPPPSPSPSPSSGQAWLDELPDAFEDVRVEVHQPGERKKLAYLATTRAGRRVYLNRTIVDADQLVVMTRRGYNPWTGYSGAELALYPRLTDEATLRELDLQLESEAPGPEPWPIQEDAREVAWLMGAAQFFVQIIEGSGDGIANILTGPLDSSDAGQQLLDARWRVTCARPADVVIAGVTGDHLTLDDLARAFFAAGRVVRPGGSIVVLSEIAPALGPGFERFRRHDDPALALGILMSEKPPDLAAASLWARAAEQAKLYLLSGLAADVAEELFAIPMERAEQARRLLGPDKTVTLLPDAHRTLAVLA